jgi:glucose/arabinose dehydrogenase
LKISPLVQRPLQGSRNQCWGGPAPTGRDRLDEQGTVGQLPALDGTHGRLRAVRPGPDGALHVTTSSGEDDEVLRVSPA